MTDPLNPIQPDETKYEPLTPADRPKSQWRRWHIPVLVFLAIASYLIVTKQNKVPYQTAEGAIFGTFYHLTYQSRDDLQAGVEAELLRVDSSLSMFNPSSIISRVNRD
jgi:thiamine biosynthesis lipoprotein